MRPPAAKRGLHKAHGPEGVAAREGTLKRSRQAAVGEAKELADVAECLQQARGEGFC